MMFRVPRLVGTPGEVAREVLHELVDQLRHQVLRSLVPDWLLDTPVEELPVTVLSRILHILLFCLWPKYREEAWRD